MVDSQNMTEKKRRGRGSKDKKNPAKGHNLHLLDFYREQIKDYLKIGVRASVVHKILQSQFPEGVEVPKNVFMAYCRRRIVI